MYYDGRTMERGSHILFQSINWIVHIMDICINGIYGYKKETRVTHNMLDIWINVLVAVFGGIGQWTGSNDLVTI